MRISGHLVRIGTGFALGAVLVAATMASRVIPGSTITQLEGVLQRIQDLGWIGAIAFIGLETVVAMSGFLPASLLGVAAGAVYGSVFGFGIAAFSTMAGAFLAFIMTRSLLRPTIARLIRDRARLQNFDSMIARDGWRFVVLLRLSPVMPFAITSYALGLSSISFREYWVGSLAALPSLLGYVLLGSLATSSLDAISHGSGLLGWGGLTIGIIVTVTATWRIGKLAIKAGFAPAHRLAGSQVQDR